MIKFDKKTMQKFNEIPDDMKSKLLSNVYCSTQLIIIKKIQM